MDVFDIMGPIMIGPSSSHTAGAVRIGLVAGKLLDEKPIFADITFYGSFAKTYRGHGTDKAVIAGILGLSPDNEGIRDIFEIAEKENLKYTFKKDLQPSDRHPNTVKIELRGINGGESEVIGSSVGGGNIVITEVNHLEVRFEGNNDTLIVIHKDYPGMIAQVTEFLAKKNINICSFRLSRSRRGGTAVMTIETDNRIPDGICDDIKEEQNIIKCILCKKTEGV